MCHRDGGGGTGYPVDNIDTPCVTAFKVGQFCSWGACLRTAWINTSQLLNWPSPESRSATLDNL